MLQTWSSSGLLGYLTAAERPELVKGILAVETSVDAFDRIPRDKLAALTRVPILIVIGDRAEDRVAASRAFEKTFNYRTSRLKAMTGVPKASAGRVRITEASRR